MKIFTLLFAILFFTSCIPPKAVTEKYEITYMDGTKDTVTITHSEDVHVRMNIDEGMKYLVVWDRPGRALINGTKQEEIPAVDYFKLIN